MPDSGTGRGERHNKKSFSLFREKSKAITVTDIYRFIEKQKQHAKAKWAEILGVSTSGYYSYLKNRNYREIRKGKGPMEHNVSADA